MKLCGFEVGLDQPLLPDRRPLRDRVASSCSSTWPASCKEITARLGIPFIFKSSFDKANRTSVGSFRGPGMEEGLHVLAEVKRQLGVPVLTDVHEYTPMDEVASVVDVLQTPAFLCRQTDFIQKVARAGKPVNIKKGQFLSPWDMKHVVDKAMATGNTHIMVCERGASFGYNNLVVRHARLAVMRDTGCPVVFDATHSVQLPGGQGSRVRRPARVRAGAGARGGGGRHRPACSWKPIPIRARRCPTARTPGRCGKMEALLETLLELDRDHQAHRLPRNPADKRLSDAVRSIRADRRATTNPTNRSHHDHDHQDPRPRNPRQPRQSHPRSRSHPGRRQLRPRDGALGRVHRHQGSGRAARWRQDAAIWARAC